MADIPLIPRTIHTELKFLVITDTITGDEVGLSTDHIVAFERKSGEPGIITLFADVTIPGQGSQTALFEVTFTGADAAAIDVWVGRQLRGEVTGTFQF